MEAKKQMIDKKKRENPSDKAMLDAISMYMQAGLYILPVKPGVKIPHTEHGYKDSTNDFAAFMKLYHTGDGVGIETGNRNNIIVVDCDVEKEKYKPALKDGNPVQLGFKKFCNEFNIKDSKDPRLNTRIIKTQSGGLHIYYKIPYGRGPLKKAVGKLPGLDLIAEGSFVVAPPSAGKYGVYQVIKDVPFKDLLEMPEEFYNFFSGNGKKEENTQKHDENEKQNRETETNFKHSKEDKELLIDIIAKIFSVQSGIGNHITIYLAGALLKRGYDELEISGIFEEAAKKNKWDGDEWKAPVQATFKKFKEGKDGIGGLSLLLKELEKGKDAYGVKYEGIINNLNELLSHKYKIILKKGEEWGIIRDSIPGREGTITYVRKKQKFDKKGFPETDEKGQFIFEDVSTELVEYNGTIYVCQLEDSKIGLTFTFDEDEPKNLPVDDAITYIIQHYGVGPRYKQRLISILRGFALQYKKNAPYIPLSPASVKDDKINIDFDTSKIPIETTLTQLHDFLINLASNPEGFLATFSWSILAPFHYYVKTLSELTVYVPNLVLSGKTKGGKTSLTDVFILKGYDVLNKDDKGNFQYHLQDVATTFTLMNSLKYSNLPAIFDEIGMQFFNYHKESIKGYGSSPRFGQRGTASQNTNKYWGIRSFVATMNDSFDPSSDLALSGRLIIIPFDERNTKRQNRDAFIKFYNSLPDGFMFAILKHLFQGKPIEELVSELENCDTPDKWVSMGIKFINKLCRQLGIPEFPEYETIKTKTETLAYEIASSLASEYDRGFSNQFHNSPIWGEVYVENKKIGNESRRFIYFTGGAFRVIMRNYNNHFKTATEYLNNIPKDDDVRVENGGKRITKRIENKYINAYEVSIPDWNEDDFGSDKDNENDPANGGNETQNSSANSDNEPKKSSTDNIPPGAAKDGFKENNETGNVYSEYSKEENKSENNDIEKQKRELGNTIAQLPDGPVKDEIIQNKEDISNEEAKLQERNREPEPVETLLDTANYHITKDFIEKIREELASEKFMLDGNNGPSFDKKHFQVYVHPTDLPLDRFNRLKAIMKVFGFEYSLIQAPYGIRFIRKLGGAANE